MKKIVLLSFLVSIALSSCTDDKRTPRSMVLPSSSCEVCHGTGWVEKKSFFGLFTTLEDCSCITIMRPYDSSGL